MIIIDEMDKPKGCGVCRFCDHGLCLASGLVIGWYGGSTDKVCPLCPIRQVYEPEEEEDA